MEHKTHNHEASLEIAKGNLPSDVLICELADLFKNYSDSTRLKIMFALSNQELCVSEIVEIIGMEQSAVSHQLKSLKDKNLLKSRREGKTVLYSLADSHVQSVLKFGYDHVIEEN